VIVPLTQSILGDALAACRRWRSHHPTCGVAVNLPPLVLAYPALPDEIEALLLQGAFRWRADCRDHRNDGHRHPIACREVLTRPRIKGIGLSIDDSSIGYASLLALLRLPFTELTIDRSFIAACETDRTIVRASISLARELGLSVVAEGNETAAVETRLRSVGCQIGQGSHFGHPMAESALHAWLGRRAKTVE
jgi:EAL domain-containing protein (putative c-di-GMP-specific phosphodiesterase class I)